MTTAHIGAYWGPRGQSVEAGVADLQRLLTALVGIDARLGGWRDQAFTKKKALAATIVTDDADDLRSRLLAGLRAAGNHADGMIEGTGTSLSWWNAADDEAAVAVLSVRLGITIPKMGFNAVTLQLPDSDNAPALYTPETGMRLCKAIIDIFRPDRADWLTRDLEQVQREPNRELRGGGVAIGKLVGHPAGWATYLRDGAGFDREMLPPTAQIERVGDGTLVTLAGDPSNPSAAEILAVRAAMGYKVEAPASPPLSATPGSAGVSAAPDAQTREPEKPTETSEQPRPLPSEPPRTAN